MYGACRIHNNLELAEEIAEKLFALDPNNAGLGGVVRYFWLRCMKMQSVCRMQLE